MTSYILENNKEILKLDEIYEKMKYLTLVDIEPKEGEVPVIRFQFVGMVGDVRFLSVRTTTYPCSQVDTLAGKEECLYPIFS